MTTPTNGKWATLKKALNLVAVMGGVLAAYLGASGYTSAAFVVGGVAVTAHAGGDFL